ncbi:S8 family serine peptidase [Phytoactinopolyspora halotolerans]|uniref:S8 family serine peptidase n=1 Tax=Phytoactinopolyspora halotolerans TaxID=1981512 RepID=A0A6L9S3R2_9ACTN|nr:S8 family serine peptidase [Phytoactinopolyspora halotolerans]NED99676.1 S8 family serine peptidase [Phytoactinopolyspora halotolerans]
MPRPHPRNRRRHSGPARLTRPASFLALSASLALAAVSLEATGTPPAGEATVRVIVELSGEPAFAVADETSADEASTDDVTSDDDGRRDATSDGKVGIDALATDRRLRARVEERRAALRSAQDDLFGAADDAGLAVDPEQQFTDLLNGVAMTVAESDVDRLADLPGVHSVAREQRLRALTDISVELIGAPDVWDRTDPGGSPARGAGTTVAVLDTGVDYTHHSLGEGFGAEHKVVDGYDFVNDDGDPMDDNGHGTHVAGVIAGEGGGSSDGGGATDSDHEVLGVAPDASISAYKVLDAGGGGWESDIIAGLEAAVDPANPHRADVVNLSLGGPGDGSDPIGRAATAAAERGVVVVAAAGNAGPGAQTVLSPAVADGVLAVGASASGLTLPTAHMVAPREEPLETFRAPYSASPPTETVTGDLVDVGAGTEEDYERVGDVTGKVVAYRASIPQDLANVQPYMLEQARLAEERGAIALLAYRGASSGPFRAPETADGSQTTDDSTAADAAADDGTVDVPLPGQESGDSFRVDSIVVLGLQELQWERLSRDLADGPVRIAVSGEDVTDRVASFSSRGPTSDFSLKPDLVAPGVEIRSAWPTAQWGPGVYRTSGTSMAAPHVAGSAALLRQLDPEADAGTVTARLIGSAVALDDVAPATAGAGRLDVEAAASAAIVASPASLSLGLADMAADDDGGVSADGVVVLRNDGAADAQVKVRTQAAPGSAGTATVTPSVATVPAGGELEVQLMVDGELPANDADLAGWIVADLVDGDAAPDPEAGSAADTDDPAPESTARQATVRVPYLLAVRPLVVQTSPDPSDGTSAAFIWSPAPLTEPPVVTVTPPRGAPYRVTATHNHDRWYRADLSGDRAGAYQVTAEATAQDGQRLTGASSFEVSDGRTGSPSPMRWQPIGPNSAAGPISTTPADDDVAVVAQYTKAGPWRTDDGGASWSQHTRLPVAAGTGEAVVDAHDADTIWYAVNGSTGGVLNAVMDPTYQGRILRSDDGGATWRVLDFPDTHVIALLGDSGTRGLVAVTADALMVSLDGGESWTAHPNPAGGDPLGAAVSGDDLYLATSSAVWTVRGLLTGSPSGTERVYRAGDGYAERIAGIAADDELVALLIGGDRVLGSSDAGANWPELYGFDGGGMTISMDGGDIMVATYRPENHIGRDHGTSWTRVPQPVPGAVEDDVAHWPGGGLLWSSPGAGLFHTDDEGGDPRRIGVPGETVHDLAVSVDERGTPQLLAGTDLDVFDTDLPLRPRLDADVAEWGLSGSEAHVGTRVGQLAVVEDEPSTVWKIRKDALSQFWVYRSTDGGTGWELRGRTVETPFDLVVAPADPNRVAVPFWSLAGSGLYVTADAGEEWRKLFHDEVFTTAASDPADPDRLWLGSSSGLFRSDDFGETVEKVLDGQVTSVAVSGSRVVAAGPEIRVSDDGGQTFAGAATGDVPMLVGDLLVSPADPDTWYAASGPFTANGLVKGGRGVLRSTDGGQTWTNVSAGLQNLDVVTLEVSPDGRWLFAGTVDGGVHRVRTR